MRPRLYGSAQDALSLRLVYFLASGDDLAFLDEASPQRPLTAEAFRVAWAQVGEALVERHCQRHPGTRPHGYWVIARGIADPYHDWDVDRYATQWHYLKRHRLLRREDPQQGPPPREDDIDAWITDCRTYKEMFNTLITAEDETRWEWMRAHPSVEWPHLDLDACRAFLEETHP
jgi:hypothetical protein